MHQDEITDPFERVALRETYRVAGRTCGEWIECSEDQLPIRNNNRPALSSGATPAYVQPPS